MNSSTAEQRLVKPLVESSNLSSSAKLFDAGEFDNDRIRDQSIPVSNNGALAERIYMHRSEIPDIVVRSHGAPQ